MVLGKQKNGIQENNEKSAGGKCENGVEIQEQDPPFQTLFPLKPKVIYCVNSFTNDKHRLQNSCIFLN